MKFQSYIFARWSRTCWRRFEKNGIKGSSSDVPLFFALPHAQSRHGGGTGRQNTLFFHILIGQSVFPLRTGYSYAFRTGVPAPVYHETHSETIGSPLVIHPARNQRRPRAGFPHGCVIALGRRQPACVLCLALRKSRFKPNSHF